MANPMQSKFVLQNGKITKKAIHIAYPAKAVTSTGKTCICVDALYKSNSVAYYNRFLFKELTEFILMRMSNLLKPLVTSTLAELANLRSVTLRYLLTLPGQISICPIQCNVKPLTDIVCLLSF